MSCRGSLLQPKKQRLVSLDFLLELQEAVQQRFGGGRAARYVDIYGYDAVASANNLFQLAKPPRVQTTFDKKHATI